MASPVIAIHLADTADQQLELALIEDIDELLRDELVEAGHKRFELVFHALLDAPFRD